MLEEGAFWLFRAGTLKAGSCAKCVALAAEAARRDAEAALRDAEATKKAAAEARRRADDAERAARSDEARARDRSALVLASAAADSEIRRLRQKEEENAARWKQIQDTQREIDEAARTPRVGGFGGPCPRCGEEKVRRRKSFADTLFCFGCGYQIVPEASRA